MTTVLLKIPPIPQPPPGTRWLTSEKTGDRWYPVRGGYTHLQVAPTAPEYAYEYVLRRWGPLRAEVAE